MKYLDLILLIGCASPVIQDEVLFIEPQKGFFVELSKKERESLFV